MMVETVALWGMALGAAGLLPFVVWIVWQMWLGTIGPENDPQPRAGSPKVEAEHATPCHWQAVPMEGEP